MYYSRSSKPKSTITTRSRAASSATLTRHHSLEHPPTHYRALSHVAANVAAAAALAAQQEEQSRWRPRQHHSADSQYAGLNDDVDKDDDEVDEDALARLADSFHSEGGRGSGRKRVSWSREPSRTRGNSVGRQRPPLMSPINSVPSSTLSPDIPLPDTYGAQDISNRGRPVTRDAPLDEAQDEWAVESTAKRKSSRASRKGAGMIFLGVWALFGVGTLAGSRRGLPLESAIRVGHVLTSASAAVYPAHAPPPSIPTPVPYISTNSPQEGPAGSSDIPFSHDHFHLVNNAATFGVDDPDDHHDGPSTEYIIGRISAWICTTLYLTSRLPQIWKNVSLTTPYRHIFSQSSA